MIAPLGTYSQQQQQPGPQGVETLQVPLVQGWPGLPAPAQVQSQRGDELRTRNPWCPACAVWRRHTPRERALYHPLAGSGINRANGGA